MQYVGVGRLRTPLSVAYTGTAGSTSNVGTQTYKVRVLVTTDAYIKIHGSAEAAATTSDTYLPALSAEYFTITPGQRVSAIQVSAGGTLQVTEIS